MGKKLNLGSGPNWHLDGWDTLDHKKISFKSKEAWNLPFSSNKYDIVFTSHMIEHITHFKIEKVISEINRVMKKGGILRILTPDLKKIATAYVNNDEGLMDMYINEDGSGIRRNLGLGHALMGFVISRGTDNYLFNRDMNEVIGAYGHVYSYDFEMLSGILSHYGFTEIKYCDIDESDIGEHKKLRSLPYDIDKLHSLIIECRKDNFIPFNLDDSVLLSKPYKIKKEINALNPLTTIFLNMFSFWNKFLEMVMNPFLQVNNYLYKKIRNNSFFYSKLRKLFRSFFR